MIPSGISSAQDARGRDRGEGSSRRLRVRPDLQPDLRTGWVVWAKQHNYTELMAIEQLPPESPFEAKHLRPSNRSCSENFDRKRTGVIISPEGSEALHSGRGLAGSSAQTVCRVLSPTDAHDERETTRRRTCRSIRSRPLIQSKRASRVGLWTVYIRTRYACPSSWFKNSPRLGTRPPAPHRTEYTP